MKNKNKKIIEDDEYKTVSIEKTNTKNMGCIKIYVYDKIRKKSVSFSINTFYEDCISCEMNY